MPSPDSHRLTARTPGVSISQPPPGSGEQLGGDRRVPAAVVALADRRRRLDVGAEEGVDERRLADAAGAEEGERAVRRRRTRAAPRCPAPVRPLATRTGTPKATSISSRRAGSGSSTRSALVSTTAGSAPLSKASTSSRSSRRWFGGAPKEWVRKTTSMLAAKRVGLGAGALERRPPHERRPAGQDVLDALAVGRRHDPVADRDVGADVADAHGRSRIRRIGAGQDRAPAPVEPRDAARRTRRAEPRSRPRRARRPTRAPQIGAVAIRHVATLTVTDVAAAGRNTIVTGDTATRSVTIHVHLPRPCCVRHRWIVIGVWVALLIGINAIAGASRPRLPHRLHAARQRVQGRPGAARGQRPEPGRLRRDRSSSRPSRASTTPQSQARSTQIIDFAAEQPGVTVTSPYDNPQQISEDGTIAFAQLDVSDRGFEEIIDLGKRSRSSATPTPSVEGLRVEYGGDLFSEFELPESRDLRHHRRRHHPHPRLRVGAGDGPADRHRAVRPRHRHGPRVAGQQRRRRCPTSRRRWWR